MVMSHAFGRNFVQGVADFSYRKNWRLASINHASFKKDISDYDGIIMRVFDDETEVMARKARKPLVDIFCEHPRTYGAQITTDHLRTAGLAADFFLARGYRHFAWCGIGDLASSVDDGKAFENVVRKTGMTFARFECPHGTNDLIGKVSPDRLPEPKKLRAFLLSLPRPCAIFTYNDHVAYAVMRTVLDLGLKVPEEISILGADNDPFVCLTAPIPISSIDSDAHGLGYNAARMLDAIMSSAPRRKTHRIFFQPPRELVERQSTAFFPSDKEWLSDILLKIEQKLGDGISTAEVIELSGYSATYVESIFKKSFKMSIHDYIVSQRMNRARDLLRKGDLSIKTIAYECGFSSPQYFCRAFRKRFGHAPSQNLKGPLDYNNSKHVQS